jgi:ABC-type lipoprotein export system ATPase subunit
LVGLGKWADHRPYEMSGGQQQRVAIARALANNPRLILADEPTGELDSSTAREILTLFQRIVAEEAVTMLIVSHDNLVYDYVAEVLKLQDGQLVESTPSST